MKEKNINMTEGNPVKLLLLFSIPMLIGNVFQQMYNLADSIIVGRFIGSDALASIGTTGPISFFFFAICNGIGSGGGIIVSQFFGRGDKSRVRNCIINTAYIMIVLPIIVGAIAFFLAEPILHLLKVPEKIINDSINYLRISCIGLFFVSMYNYVSSMLRALGDSKTPLYFLIFACLLNVGLDILFIKAFSMGVVGVGIATVIAQLISGGFCLIFAIKTNSFFKFESKDFFVNYSIMRDIVKIGIPMSFQFSLIAISCMALQAVVNSFGSIAVAAFTATGKIEEFVHLPYQTLSAALSTFCGQNYGAKKIDRMILGYRKSMMIMTIFTVAVIPIFQFFSNEITAIFVDNSEVIKIGGKALQISSLFYFALGTIYTVRGILYGAGDSIFSFLNGIVEVIGRFTIPILLTSWFGIGVFGIWWSVGIVWVVSAIVAFYRYVVIRKRLNKMVNQIGAS